MQSGNSSIHAHPGRLPCGHVVQFYQDPEFMHRTAAEFLVQGLREDAALIAVLHASDHAALCDYLANQEVDVDDLRARGQLLLLDATETLSRFMIDGMPDPTLFRDLAGSTLSSLLESSGKMRVRGYGEMVGQLWKEGNHEAALELERLWNEIARWIPLSLMCGYGVTGFRNESEARSFDDICAQHSLVLPSESGGPGSFTALPRRRPN